MTSSAFYDNRHQFLVRWAAKIVAVLFAGVMLGCPQSSHPAPTAAFEMTGNTGYAPVTISFDGNASTATPGKILKWKWAFGDGTTDEGAIVTHTFNVVGQISVSLVVVDDSGTSSTSAAKSITILGAQLTDIAVLDGSLGDGTQVYRVTIPLDFAGITRSILIRDNNSDGGDSGSTTGFDLDAVRLSTTKCDDAACVDSVDILDLFDLTAEGELFQGGPQNPPVDPMPLFGTDPTGIFVSDPIASLDRFDGIWSSGPDAGFVSLGRYGTITFNLQRPLPDGAVYLYVGEVGDNSDVQSALYYVASSPVTTVLPQGHVSMDILETNLANGFAVNGQTVDLLGDGQALYSQQVSGGVMVSEQIVLDGVTVQSNNYAGDTSSLASFDDNGTKRHLTQMTPATDGSGAVAYVVVDYATDSATPDRRQRFTDDPTQQTVTIMVDQDASHSGNWTDNTMVTRPFAEQESDFVYSNLSVDQTTCTQQQQQMIRTAAKDAVKFGGECLFNMKSPLRWQFAIFAAEPKYKLSVSCGVASDPALCADHSPDRKIVVYMNNWVQGGLCTTQDFAGVIFHEILHEESLMGRHLTTDQYNDQIYACQRVCFAAAPAASDCAMCLGTGVDRSDPRCQSLLNQGASQPPDGGNAGCEWCPCNSTAYGDTADGENACLVDCPITLGCFANICGPCPPPGLR